MQATWTSAGWVGKGSWKPSYLRAHEAEAEPPLVLPAAGGAPTSVGRYLVGQG